MEYTKNYKLPQWVETDRILMEDFNDAMENLEVGLSAVKSIADSAKSMAEEGSEKLPDLEMRMAAVEQEVKFVKLGGPVTTTASGTSIIFDLSGINMNEYTALVVIGNGVVSYNTVSVAVNGTGVCGFFASNGEMSASMVWLQPCKTSTFAFATCSGVASNYGWTNDTGYVNIAWSNIKQVSIASTVAEKGLSGTLYGIKG